MLDSYLNIKTNQEPLEDSPEEINEKFFTVSEITRGIKTSLEHKFSNIGVLGEISNVRKPSSGHVYSIPNPRDIINSSLHLNLYFHPTWQFELH